MSEPGGGILLSACHSHASPFLAQTALVQKGRTAEVVVRPTKTKRKFAAKVKMNMSSSEIIFQNKPFLFLILQ